MLELHVWGPGFGLPSIDAGCLAAIAYCNLVLSPTDWRVIPSSNPLLSPSKSLPALRSAPGVWHSGLPAIIAHLATLHPPLDSHLPAGTTATLTALTAYLHLHAPPLLDLLLYANPRNFSTTTRPTIAALLPFPRRYYVPVQLQSAALTRTAHLGFSFPAPSAAHRDPIDAAEQARADARRKIPKTQALEKMRIARMVDELLAHVDRRIAQGILGDEEVTAADCVALGYLALLNAEVAEAFGREGIGRWERVRAYVERMGGRVWGGVPVGQAEKGDLLWLGAEVVEAAKRWVGVAERVEGVEEEGEEAERVKAEMGRREREWWVSAAWVAAGVAAWVGYVLTSGMAGAAVGPQVVEGQEVEEGRDGEVEEEEKEEIQDAEEEVVEVPLEELGQNPLGFSWIGVSGDGEDGEIFGGDVEDEDDGDDDI